ncbi:MAG: hypothetical protein WDO13_05310 [Verrucomicrobiota bacterium]
MKPGALFLAAALLGLPGVAAPVHAEDWTTSDGKVYVNVTVLKVEGDAVTIFDRDGGALVPLSKLPPSLQARFHYDPVQATAAAQTRAQADAQSAAALQTERVAAQKKAAAAQQAEQAANAKTPAAKSSGSTDAVDLSKIDQNWGDDDATHHRDLDYPLKHPH